MLPITWLIEWLPLLTYKWDVQVWIFVLEAGYPDTLHLF
jgi:hypothetical protein